MESLLGSIILCSVLRDQSLKQEKSCSLKTEYYKNKVRNLNILPRFKLT